MSFAETTTDPPTTHAPLGPADGLNERQRQAVTHPGGPLLVVAGAGSGKTRVLTQRIAWLLGQGVPAHRILAITFTNKAAAEMSERIQALCGAQVDGMWVSTFHSACARILRTHAGAVGLPREFSIYDQSDALRVVRAVVDALDLDPQLVPPARLLRTISSWKNGLVSVDDAELLADSDRDRTAALVYRTYQHRLQSVGAVDFDDLLTHVVELLRTHPDVLSGYQKRFAHILVDEYQDTNGAQNEIVTRLAAQHRNLCVVGDTDQAIYAFRGADYRNIHTFEELFPDATVVVLDQNYRSTRAILAAANAVIANNTTRRPKDLWSVGGAGSPVVVHQAGDEYDEARWVVDQLAEFHRQGSRWADQAVLYRTNAQSRVFEEHLLAAGIPYRVVGGLRFYERAEIKDVVAYLRAVVNPADELAFRRAFASPRRGVGQRSLDQLAEFARLHELPFGSVLDDPEAAGLRGRAATAVGEFAQLCRDVVGAGPRPVDMIRHILERSGFEDALVADGGPEALGRLDNVRELLSVAYGFATAQDFLEQVALVSDTDDITDDDYLKLMTVHAAKGLEFPIVAVVGLEEDIFPHSRSVADPAAVEEERRLAYVAMTRAEQRLLLSMSATRVVFGVRKDQVPSRFLVEIPPSLTCDHLTSRPLDDSVLDDMGWGNRGDGDQQRGGVWDFL